MIQRLFYTFIISLLLVVPVYADTSGSDTDKGLTAEKCFKEVPSSVIGLISPNTRLDMLDYYRAGIDRPSSNSVGGKCAITDLQDYSIIFDGGNGIEYQMFVLDPTSTKPVIGLIQTLDTPIPDSAVTLYRSDWSVIPAPTGKALDREPGFDAWIKPTYLGQIDKISETVPFIMAKLIYDPATGTLTASNNTSQYFTATDTPASLSMLKDKISYKWQSKVKAFLPEK